MLYLSRICAGDGASEETGVNTHQAPAAPVSSEAVLNDVLRGKQLTVEILCSHDALDEIIV